MRSDRILREQVLFRLNADDAHVNVEAAVGGLPAQLRGKRPDGAEHSPWEVLEHIRIAQSDILEFIRDPKHFSPDFPQGYWPGAAAPPTEIAWEESVARYRKDLAELSEIVQNVDLLKPIAHAPDKTVLRQLLLLQDHTAYHVGQLVTLRRLLGAWQ